MAKAGWRQEDIDQLEKEVELAVRKAEAASFGNGDTLARQKQLMKAAERDVRDAAHDRWHRELEDAQKEINAMNAFVAENPGEHYSASVALKALEASGPDGHKHLQVPKTKVPAPVKKGG